MEMILALAAGNAAEGHSVLIAHGVRPETPSDPRDQVDPAVELRQLHSWTRRTPAAQVRAAAEVRDLIDEWQPDVLHLHSSFAGIVGAMAVGKDVRRVWSPNAFASAVPGAGRIQRGLYRAGERLVCRRADVIGAVSSSEAELAWELGSQSVLRVRNGIRELDAAHVRTRPDHCAEEAPRVVASGRTVPQRQPAACARILAGVRDVAEVEWLGGGNGKPGAEGQEALEALDIPMSGWLAREDLLDRVASSSVYLHWTAWDGLPLSILEALALDTVVVASDIPPNREILGKAGVFSTEAEAIAELRRLVEDPVYAEERRIAQRARRREFSAEKMVSGWHEVYGRLATANGDLRLAWA